MTKIQIVMSRYKATKNTGTVLKLSFEELFRSAMYRFGTLNMF